ncbi:RidA family protein [Bartonella ancashensis]|uniref:Endoribonuclease L-PSP n=1 Tax=Bartonella ancashensis TaxID=1318743 RepID=A0A0M3T333_9HYPH|nr:RidA family protein [Bartonella ancashensis]ALE03901.1 Endoribonuclease L-PSP [Bartonella ancashensis]
MTNSIEGHLEQLGIVIPVATSSIANYKAVQQSGNQLFISGQLPLTNGKPLVIGKVGATVTTEQAKNSAKLCALNILAQAKLFLENLDKIKRIVKITVFVAVDPNFTDLPSIANEASNLLIKIFGEVGKHSRSTIGVAVLPMDVPVEIEAIIEI